MTLRRLTPLFLVCALAAACGGDDDSPAAPSGPPVPFSTIELQAGTGTQAVSGSRVSVNYAGWLYSATGTDNKGQLFDSSTGRGPLSFTLGARQVVSGFDQGVTGMRVGGVRRIIVPSDLAYGAAGNPPAIPPNAALVFEVELVSVQ
jgi:FKBP-type peptidyl-prolyl cis-trans isomerase FkpA